MKDFRRNRTLGAVSYWTNALFKYVAPRALFAGDLRRCLDSLTANERQYVEQRAAYYCRLASPAAMPTTTTVGDFGIPWRARHRHSRYVMDLYEVLCRFHADYRFDYLFGDITCEAATPAFVKSRPVTDGTTNSVLMKLDKYRHFRTVHDVVPFADKRDMLVSRNHVAQPHRRLLLEKYFGHPMCNVGKINVDADEQHHEWVMPFMTIDEQLQYKFIACLEGNDVASNLKWVMSSNSLAVMPRPRYETWFMEGTLQPGVHYVEVKPDYSDLIDQMQHYIAHPAEAEAIISNAHAYVAAFANRRLELATQLATAQAYFQATGQVQ